MRNPTANQVIHEDYRVNRRIWNADGGVESGAKRCVACQKRVPSDGDHCIRCAAEEETK